MGFALVLALYACGGDDDGSSPPPGADGAVVLEDGGVLESDGALTPDTAKPSR